MCGWYGQGWQTWENNSLIVYLNVISKTALFSKLILGNPSLPTLFPIMTTIPGFPLSVPFPPFCFSSGVRELSEWEWSYLRPGPLPHCLLWDLPLAGKSCLCLKGCPLAGGPVPSQNIRLLAADSHSACELILGDTKNFVHFVEADFQLHSVVGISPFLAQMILCLWTNPLNNVQQECLQTSQDTPESCKRADGVVLSQHRAAPRQKLFNNILFLAQQDQNTHSEDLVPSQ